jgi:hypothetical protein
VVPGPRCRGLGQRMKVPLGHICGLLKNWLVGEPFLGVRDFLR